MGAMTDRCFPASLLVLLLLAAPALAQQSADQGGRTGTAPAPLPPPDCVKPDPKPLEMRPGNDSSGIAAYNAKVHRFNRLSVAFTACTKAYDDKVAQEITRLRAATKARLQQAVDLTNGRVRTVAAQVNGAIAVASGDPAPPPVTSPPDPDFPPSTCRAPDKALLKRTARLKRVSVSAADAYDAQQKTFEDCTAAYIDAGKAEIQRLQQQAETAQQQTVARANRRIELLNRLMAQAADGANDLARATIAELGADAR